jgi:hypothetical protein
MEYQCLARSCSGATPLFAVNHWPRQLALSATKPMLPEQHMITHQRLRRSRE